MPASSPNPDDVLARIEAYKRREVAEAKLRAPLAALEAAAADAPPPHGFADALAAAAAAGRPGLIAEIKRSSPSRGVIREAFDPAALAEGYARGGATCLSVLTDGPSFGGDPEHVALARLACPLPVLRKDFLFEPYQAVESRAWGADCVLVIMACLDDEEASDIVAASHELGMDVLAEVHDEAEMERALALGTRLVGINNRDLRDFSVSADNALRLAGLVGPDRIAVAESGIFGAADIPPLIAAGMQAFLVGESLLRQEDVASATRKLLDLPPPTTAGRKGRGHP